MAEPRALGFARVSDRPDALEKSLKGTERSGVLAYFAKVSDRSDESKKTAKGTELIGGFAGFLDQQTLAFRVLVE